MHTYPVRCTHTRVVIGSHTNTTAQRASRRVPLLSKRGEELQVPARASPRGAPCCRACQFRARALCAFVQLRAAAAPSRAIHSNDTRTASDRCIGPCRVRELRDHRGVLLRACVRARARGHGRACVRACVRGRCAPFPEGAPHHVQLYPPRRRRPARQQLWHVVPCGNMVHSLQSSPYHSPSAPCRPRPVYK
jgi:hypothetical protein